MRLLKEPLALLLIGNALPVPLPEIATRLILEGHDSPSLRELAGLDCGQERDSDIVEAFQRTCKECGVSIITKKEAAIYLLEVWFSDIREHRIAPFEGCEKIVQQIYYPTHDMFPDNTVCGEGFGFPELIGIYWSYDDLDHKEMLYEDRIISRSEGRSILDSAVIRVAQKWHRGLIPN